MTKKQKQLLVRTFNHIVRNPKEWNQTNWACGTSHCFGGWAITLGKEQISAGILGHIVNTNTARDLLGLTTIEADYIFDADRSLYEIEIFVRCKINDIPQLFYTTNCTQKITDKDGRNQYGFLTGQEYKPKLIRMP